MSSGRIHARKIGGHVKTGEYSQLDKKRRIPLKFTGSAVENLNNPG